MDLVLKRRTFNDGEKTGQNPSSKGVGRVLLAPGLRVPGNYRGGSATTTFPLFPTRLARSGLNLAWDGWIDAGNAMKPVRSLQDYFTYSSLFL